MHSRQTEHVSRQCWGKSTRTNAVYSKRTLLKSNSHFIILRRSWLLSLICFVSFQFCFNFRKYCIQLFFCNLRNNFFLNCIFVWFMYCVGKWWLNFTLLIIVFTVKMLALATFRCIRSLDMTQHTYPILRYCSSYSSSIRWLIIYCLFSILFIINHRQTFKGDKRISAKNPEEDNINKLGLAIRIRPIFGPLF